MLSKINKGLREENKKLLEENARIKDSRNWYEAWNRDLVNENLDLKRVNNLQFLDLVKYEKEIKELKDENRYLLQRLKELRHKSWFGVYKENLELQEQNKNLDETCQEVIEEYRKLEKEFEQYKGIVKSIEIFVGRFSNEKR
jgi:hypothetical protein